ncbi:CshA/CshB family fibrillar adhesin-related protein, partial [Agromyces sp. NPDC060279]|uniref:CshA/CshB family fibrillar adhesin-related protein n=1 Tax=Agromyces sp. NPDC060279 TaxID=3347092 RepID=UPI003655F320
MGLVGVSVAGAQAATSATCGFADAGTGKYAQALCWFDFAGYNAAEATSAAGQQMEVTLPGGSRMTFTLKASGGGVTGSVIPTWGGAYLGNREYRGIPGRPALYQATSGTTTDLTLSDIRMFSPQGVEMQSFSLVGAEAESTDGNESLRWTSNNPIYSLTANGSNPGIGNACPGGFTGVGTTQVTCSAGGQSTSPQTGGPILASQNPDFWTQRMVGGGRQAVAFGALISRLELRKQVDSRFTGDDFKLTIDDRNGNWHFEGSTGPTGTTSTTELREIIDDGAGDPVFRFAEQMNSGLLSNYNAAWSCTRNGARDSTLPSGRQPGYASDIHVGIGDVVVCTIANSVKATGVSLVKKAGDPEDVNGNRLTDAGDRITYQFEVTNTGELPLDPVVVDDPKIGSVTCPAGPLEPDLTVTCTADAAYTITADDEDAGAVENTATASGTPIGTSDPVTSRQARTRTPVTAAQPAIELSKAASPADAASFVVGQEITYTFVVTNTGNVPVHDVEISEDSFSGSGEMSVIDCPADRTIDPDASITCTASYTLTQADIDAGSLENTASASGIPAGTDQPIRTDQSEAVIPGDPRPAIDLEKSASPSTIAQPGETVTYTFHVTNTGNVTLNDPSITETAFSGTGEPLEISCPAGPLAPGASADCVASYVVTQADVDAGRIDNTATATATAPAGQDAPVSDASSATATIPPSPGLTIEKTADVEQYSEAGQIITYQFDVTNSGNVTLSDVAVADVDFTGSGELSEISCPADTLGGGESMTCTATYTVTQDDVDSGGIDNAATASGTPAGADEPIETPRSNVSVPAEQHAALELAKSVDQAEAAEGDTVTYSFRVTNTGNVSIGELSIDETEFTGAGELGAPQCPDVTLAPGESITCTASYTLVAGDNASDSIENTAVATGVAPSSMADEHPRSNESSASVAVLAPSLSLVKSADSGELVAGEVVTYSFLVTNTG